jgi:hypothetical protein
MADNLSAPGLAQDNALIDRIIYLASLASIHDTIDKDLDILRSITARRQATELLKIEEREQLFGLEERLKDYLIHHDPLRSFTVETLEERLQKQAHPKLPTQINAYLLALAVAIASSGIAMIIPPFDMSMSLRIALAISFYLFAVQVGTAWFYLSSLSNFKAGLRRAFLLISAGTIMFGLLYTNYILTDYTGLARYPLFRHSIIAALTAGIGFFLIYLGLRCYARLVGARSWAASLRLMAAVYVCTLIILVLTPHAKLTADEALYAYLVLPGSVGTVLPQLFGSFLARRVRSNATPAHARPLHILQWYLIIVAVPSLGGLLATWWFGEIMGTNRNIYFLSGIIPEAVLMYTGYIFKKGTSR